MQSECSQNVVKMYPERSQNVVVVIGGHWRSLEVIVGRLRSIQGLFSSLRAICRMDGWDGIGWLSLGVGSPRAPLVLITL